MFKNKAVIKYKFIHDKYNNKSVAEEMIDKILEKATPKSSEWWRKLPSFKEGVTNKVKHIIDIHKDILVNKLTLNPDEPVVTAKSCPGIHFLFKRTFLVKAPCDAVITINDKGDVIGSIVQEDLMTITDHPRWQFISPGNNLFAGKICLKFNIQVELQCKNAGYMFDHPIYHNNPGFTVASGYISEKFRKGQQLNIITFVDLPEEGKVKNIVIKAGDVLSYIITPEDDVVLEYSNSRFMALVARRTFRSKLTY